MEALQLGRGRKCWVAVGGFRVRVEVGDQVTVDILHLGWKKKRCWDEGRGGRLGDREGQRGMRDCHHHFLIFTKATPFEPVAIVTTAGVHL